MRRPIIVIDDDPVLLTLFEEILTDEGYRVLLWQQSTGAFDGIQAWQPALIILDLRLERPDSGWALLKLLRISSQTATLPIIVCSADVEYLTSHAQELEQLQVALLKKPFAVDELLALVAQRLKASRPG